MSTRKCRTVTNLDFWVCESVELSQIWIFGRAKVQNCHKFGFWVCESVELSPISQKKPYGLSSRPPTSVSLEFWVTRCAIYTIYSTWAMVWVAFANYLRTKTIDLELFRGTGVTRRRTEPGNPCACFPDDARSTRQTRSNDYEMEEGGTMDGTEGNN